MIIGKFYPLPKKSNCYFNKCLYIYITFLNIRNITVTDPKPNENIIEFKAGELIYKFDDKSDCAYFLKKGEVFDKPNIFYPFGGCVMILFFIYMKIILLCLAYIFINDDQHIGFVI